MFDDLQDNDLELLFIASNAFAEDIEHEPTTKRGNCSVLVYFPYLVLLLFIFEMINAIRY